MESKFGVFVIGFIMLGALIFSIIAVNHTETKTCTITSKESVARDSEHEYRVYTEQCGTLSVKDSWLKMRFNSADVYGSIQEGKTYEVTTMGFRIPLISSFPNILEVR